MEKTYSRRQDAARAAKKEFGSLDLVNIVPQGDRFIYELKIQKELDVINDLAKHEEAEADKKAKAKAIKAKHVQAEPPANQSWLKENMSAENAEDIQREMDRRGNKALLNSDPSYTRRSTVAPGVKATKLVWEIADSMPGSTRSEVVKACVDQGVATGTARTQYQHWFKTKNQAEKAIRSRIEDGRIIPASTI